MKAEKKVENMDEVRQRMNSPKKSLSLRMKFQANLKSLILEI